MSERADPVYDDSGAPTREWSLAQIDAYLRGSLRVHDFWQPISAILTNLTGLSDDPVHKMVYLWREIGRDTMSVVKWGYPEDDLKTFLMRCRIAIEMTDERWSELVYRKGRPLEHNEEDWDVL